MQDIIIFDLDGTLADIEHRQHLVMGAKKQWREFFAACTADKPHAAVISVLRALHATYQIYIVSGRSDEVREQTRLARGAERTLPPAHHAQAWRLHAG